MNPFAYVLIERIENKLINMGKIGNNTMYTFSGITYERPDYNKQKEILKKYKEEMISARSYVELRRLWLSMKETMEYVDFIEQYAFNCYLCGVSYKFYKEEVKIHDIEHPLLSSLKKDCDNIIIRSPYVEKFSNEFGGKIVAQLKNINMLTDERILSMQLTESELKTEYTSLLAVGQYNDHLIRKYEILDSLIRIRTKIAQTLGFQNYIEMAYILHERFDYGTKEIKIFRSQIKKFITPVCYEIRKSNEVSYPATTISEADELIIKIKNMFCDISEESGDYLNYILAHEFIDLADRPFKRPNYFACCMIPYVKTPFIIGCFHGSGLDVNYLIHELAHGYAFYSAARAQKLYEYHRAGTSINEIHSKTMEYLAYPYMDDFFGSNKNSYFFNHIFHDIDNLPYRCAIDEFEHAIYEDINMTCVQRCGLWAEIEKEYMPWRMSNLEAIKAGTYWPNQTHLFTHPFYYIEYDIAQMSVFEFYGRSKSNFKQTWNEYSKLCHAGGSLNYLDLLKVGNLTNPFTDNALEKICGPVLNEISSYMP